MSVKRIAILTTSCTPPLLVKAVYKDGILNIADPEYLPVARKALFEKAVPQLKKLVDRGFMVLVDERTKLLAEASGAKCVNMSSKTRQGDPVIVVAFNTARELKRQYALVAPKKSAVAFDIPDTLVNEVHSPSGEITFKVDWENIRGEQYLTLLAAYATQFHDVGSAAYIREMMGEKPEEKQNTSPLAAIVNYETMKEEESRSKSMAGQKIDDNSWYL